MSLADPTNSDIMQSLGVLQGQFSGIADRLDRADHSREVLYGKLEEQGKAVNDISFAVKVAADVAAQARDRVDQVAAASASNVAEIEKKLEPMIAQWQKVDTIGKAVVALLAVGGLSFAGIVIWAGQLITTAVQHWLGITPH